MLAGRLVNGAHECEAKIALNPSAIQLNHRSNDRFAIASGGHSLQQRFLRESVKTHAFCFGNKCQLFMQLNRYAEVEFAGKVASWLNAFFATNF